MKAKVKETGGERMLMLPSDGHDGLGAGEVELRVLRPGVVLASTAQAWAEMEAGAGRKRPEEDGQAQAGAERGPAGRKAGEIPRSTSAGAPDLDGAEAALVAKLMDIRFGERLVPAVQKKLGPEEKRMLDALVSRGLITVYKNAKYKEGVYSIPQSTFSAVSHENGNRKGEERSADAQAPPRAAANPAGRTAPNPSGGPPSASTIPLNSPAHLAKYGYMVLDNENEARAVMEGVKDVQKTDPVKGVRGFDRRYYVLRRSFMAEHREQILQKLEQGPARAEDVAADLGLAPAAAGVLLMILADDGDVVEKRKGLWDRA